MNRGLIDYVIRNANYLETDSFGFAHYRRPDYLVARNEGIEFVASPRLSYIAGAKVLVNKWVLAHEEDLTRLQEIQVELAETFGAPTFATLIKEWDQYVKGYSERLSHSDQAGALQNEGYWCGGVKPMWTGRPFPGTRTPEEKQKYFAFAYNSAVKFSS